LTTTPQDHGDIDQRGTPPEQPAKLKRAVTQRDVAIRCGLHQSTVSRVYRRDPMIPLETIERVLAVAHEMGYNPAHHSLASRLVSYRHGHAVINNMVAMSAPPTFMYYHYDAALFRGVSAELMQAGFALVLTDLSSALYEDKAEFPLCITRGDVDGILCYYAPDEIQRLAERRQQTPALAGKPVVTMIFANEAFSAVATDDQQGAYLAARHLLELGHRHLLYLCTEYDPHPDTTQARRLAGTRRALTEFGLDPVAHVHLFRVIYEWLNPLWISQTVRLPSTVGNEHSLVRYLREHPAVTAILGMNDNTAIIAWTLLNQAGYHVPTDISIIGFDDVDPYVDEQGRNLLTTVRLPLEQVGQQAARLLVQQITGRDEDRAQLILPVELVVRASTGPAALRR